VIIHSQKLIKIWK